MIEKSFDIRSVMDILYGEEYKNTDGTFICADDGKQKALKAEVIQLQKSCEKLTPLGVGWIAQKNIK